MDKFFAFQQLRDSAQNGTIYSIRCVQWNKWWACGACPGAHARGSRVAVWLVEGRRRRDERTVEVQPGEGGVDTKGGDQLLAALVADNIVCVQRSGVWACGACPDAHARG